MNFFLQLIAVDSIMMFAHVGVVAGAYFIATLLGSHADLDPDHDPTLRTAITGLWVAFVSS